MGDSFLPPVIAVLAANVSGFTAGMLEAKGEMGTVVDESSRMGASAKIGFAAVTAAVVAVAGASVKMAADFQTSTTKLLTSGGEIQSNIDMVRKGLLDMAGQVGVSATDLSDAMYKVESAGYHGAAGLGLLKAAEQGAKAEGADGAVVADALSSAMRDYYPHAQSAAEVTKASADVMSKFIGATSAGKMTFDELSGSLNSILPVASAAKIQLSDVLGVLASMTVHGISADQAAQNMADSIRHLQNPTQAMSKAMATLGIDSMDVSQKLGQRGLSGTMEYLSEKVKSAMPPGTDKVILNLGTALSKSTPQVQALGQKLLEGSVTAKDYSAALSTLDPISAKQAQAFGTLAGSYHQIGTQQLSGAQVMQTYGGMMNKVMGDATGLKVALMTTGENAQYTKDAINQVSKSTADASGNVKGWSEVQGTFNQHLAEAKARLGAIAIELGTKLLPGLTSLMDKGGAAIHQFMQGFSGGDTSSGMAKIGAAIKPIVEDLRKFAKDAVATFRNLWSAVKPAAEVIGVELFGAIKGTAAFLANVLGPVLKAVSGFFKEHQGIVIALVQLALIPLYARLIAMPFKAVTSAAKSFFGAFEDGVNSVKKSAEAIESFGKNVIKFGKNVADTTTTVVKWSGQMLTQFGSVSKAATTRAFESSSAWLASTARMIGQGVAQAAQWVAQMAAKFAAVVASAVSSAASAAAAWLASAATMIGQGIAQAAVWVAAMLAKYAIVVAGAIASAAATVAAWVAANAAIIVATGGIALAIAALVAAGIWLARNWDDVWGAIKHIAHVAWQWIDTYIVHPLTDAWDAVARAVGDFATAWDGFWHDIGASLQWVWDHTIGPVVKFIKGAIDDIKKGISWVGSHATQIATGLGGYADGGPIPGAAGAPQLAIVHGGEYVLSRDMLAGRAQPTGLSQLLAATPSAASAVTAGAAPRGSAGGNLIVNVVVRGSLLSTRHDIKQAVQEVFLQNGMRNVQSGLNFATD